MQGSSLEGSLQGSSRIAQKRPLLQRLTCLLDQSGVAGVLAQSASIGSAMNKIGMTSSSFNSCYTSHCNSAYGYCTQVAGGSPYDQFDVYEGGSIAASLSAGTRSTCYFAGNANMTFSGSIYPVQLATCDYGAPAQMIATLTVNASMLGFSSGAPTVRLVLFVV